jgi:hypothetical protein
LVDQQVDVFVRSPKGRASRELSCSPTTLSLCHSVFAELMPMSATFGTITWKRTGKLKELAEAKKKLSGK